jgi:hypothetical protein
MMVRSCHPFVLRLAAGFIVAAVALALCTVGFLAVCKELFVYSDDAILPQPDDVLWGPAFGQDFGTYKLTRARHLARDILVLGSSRVTQIRDFMLPAGQSYNASLGVTDITEVAPFLDQLYRTKTPKLVLLGIDGWWFDGNRTGRCGWQAYCKFEFDHRQLVSNALRRFFDPQFMKSLVTSDLSHTQDMLGRRRAIGYSAHKYADGFRPDGSYQYGGMILNLHPNLETLALGQGRDFVGYRDAVAKNRGRFQYIGPPSARKMAALRAALELNRVHDVKTILFFPSFAGAIWDEIENNGDQRGFYSQIRDEVSAIAAEYQVELFDFQDLASLGIADRHTIDGLHSDEVANLAALIHMARESRVLARYYRPDELEKLAKMLVSSESWVGPHQIAQ